MMIAASKKFNRKASKQNLELQIENRTGTLMLVPATLLLLLFVVVPVCLSFILAFTNARLVSSTSPQFVGLTNFAAMFADSAFWAALKNVTIFTVVVVPVQAGLGLLLAVLINKKVRSSVFFRTIYFLPVITSMVVVSLLWLFIYQNDGMLNIVLQKLTFGMFKGVDWLNNPKTALGAIIFMSIWQAVGNHMLIWLSGLQTIPNDLYEAANLDGCSTWQQFKHVTWPCLRSTRNMILVTITIAATSVFTQVNVMTSGGPLNSTTTVVYQAIQAGFKQQEIGYASAITLVYFVLILIITMVLRYLTRDKD
ncbi:MAG: sugar ABC transporter permease [Bifidobacterium aquikefiri]|nr:sugar ABC transporter permease [Bifidobacterium aquikefiri]